MVYFLHATIASSATPSACLKLSDKTMSNFIYFAPLSIILVALILVPLVFAFVISIVRSNHLRSLIIIVISAVLALASFILFLRVTLTHQIIHYTPGLIDWNLLVTIADFGLMAMFIRMGVRRKSAFILVFAAIQTLILAWVEFGPKRAEMAYPPIFIDWLSIVMTLIVSIVGSIVAVYSLPYMREHERHQNLKISKQPQFFRTLLLFLGAMNGMVLSGNLLWIYFFWEITTLCSFCLISHDETEESIRNATRALWMNMLGGVGFITGIALIQFKNLPLDSSRLLQLVQTGNEANIVALLILPMACLCFAGFTKAAQMPFQSWLLGAMVAPTPVSALLHSSTMVKAGVYLIIRFAPIFRHTALSEMVAIVGAFSFLTGAMLAIGQSNAKKVLAYSTISNLGLIIACAGLNTPLALAAAVMLIVFHAVSKGLLFMATGVVDQTIHSKDIEDMQGLWAKMPLTSLIMVIGILSMLLPPFGVLIAKLAAIESSIQNPLVMAMLVIGSTLTVVFWTKWMGGMLATNPHADGRKRESLPALYVGSLAALASGAVILSLFVKPILENLVLPAVANYYNVAGMETTPTVLNAPWLMIFLVVALSVLAPTFFNHLRSSQIKPAYLCGEQISSHSATARFLTVADSAAEMTVRSYYFEKLTDESVHVKWVTIFATLLIVILFGAVYL